ncbi:FadR/GntR family transcriptional regulator [Falsibacillus albus]|uniref:FadR family transcriptional regulator n=1 Tax=Falsibacillus albus TaxID=2478915 RepID=A0A3L7KCJ8_9BACI|nr:FadR family transcriptional regulator [Falsibacillus albus]
MIDCDGLKKGDKIPSERELSERLNVGRSSVREALRALELLGLIETRRGEGTFLRDFRDHQLVELLSTFILQDADVKNDVEHTKELLEKDCLRLVAKEHMEQKSGLATITDSIHSKQIQSEDELFKAIFYLSKNRLLLKIWFILNQYHSQLSSERKIDDIDLPLKLIAGLMEGDHEQAIQIYDEMQKLSKQR